MVRGDDVSLKLYSEILGLVSLMLIMSLVVSPWSHHVLVARHLWPASVSPAFFLSKAEHALCH